MSAPKIRAALGIFVVALSTAATAELPVAGEVQKISGGFGFTEGPVWHVSQRALYFSDLKTKTIHRWTSDAGVELVREGGEMPNGLAINPEGALLICEPGAGRVILRDGKGRETVLVDEVSGARLGNPNDVWAAPDGGFYFTIPNPPKRSPDENEEDRLRGVIVHVDPAGEAKVASEALDLRSPNGITGSADGKQIYYTNRGKAWMASIGPDGMLSDPRVAGDTGWDGLALDEHGNLYTTAEDGVGVFGPTGKSLGVIPVPEKVANFCFGGEDGRTLFIAARTGLYAVAMRVRGSGSDDKASSQEP